MKKLFFPLIAFVLSAGAFTSCSDDEEIIIVDPVYRDFAPTVLNVFVNNSAGENLFSDSTSDNLLHKSLKVVIDSDTSPVHVYSWSSTSRANDIEFFRGRVVLDKDPRRLEIGQFRTDSCWSHDVSIIIEDTEYKMSLSHTYTTEENKEVVATSVTYDGKMTTDIVYPTVDITW